MAEALTRADIERRIEERNQQFEGLLVEKWQLTRLDSLWDPPPSLNLQITVDQNGNGIINNPETLKEWGFNIASQMSRDALFAMLDTVFDA